MRSMGLSFLHANSEDSDQTGWMPGLIYAGRTCHFVGFVMRRLKWNMSRENLPSVRRKPAQQHKLASLGISHIAAAGNVASRQRITKVLTRWLAGLRLCRRHKA